MAAETRVAATGHPACAWGFRPPDVHREQTALLPPWDGGPVEVATRLDPGAVWGPTVEVVEETEQGEPDENPAYGPGNPDWERDFEKTGESAWRLSKGLCCPVCGHAWTRHDPSDGACDAHSDEEEVFGPCGCGRDIRFTTQRNAALSSTALRAESSQPRPEGG